MTKLATERGSVFELEIGDPVRLGITEYSVRGFTRGGMGFILFFTVYRSVRPRERF